MDLFGDQATTSDALLFDSDRRLIVEIISRELSDRSINDEVNFKRRTMCFQFSFHFSFRQQLLIYHCWH